MRSWVALVLLIKNLLCMAGFLQFAYEYDDSDDDQNFHYSNPPFLTYRTFCSDGRVSCSSRLPSCRHKIALIPSSSALVKYLWPIFWHPLTGGCHFCFFPSCNPLQNVANRFMMPLLPHRLISFFLQLAANRPVAVPLVVTNPDKGDGLLFPFV